MGRPLIIGITECSKKSYLNYQRWIEGNHIEVIQLSYTKNNISDIEKCNGIVLSGGEDVHPRYYQKNESVHECHSINEKRDVFEFNVLENSQKLQLPVLGICRGLEITNVYFGGTLLPDLVSRQKNDHTKLAKLDRYHDVNVMTDTFMHQITNVTSGEVNSSHHQAADRIGNGLIVNSLSPDHVIEGLERADEKAPYLLLVQWHPERMNDPESVFSRNIKESFLKAAIKR
jgi:putative glutamine amidotransferase